MRFGILGPLSVTDAGQDVAITAGRDRVVLAMLLLHPGRIVGAEDLIDAVWEASPPATARGQLQTCVSRLRRTLPPGAILTDPAGYGIRPRDDELDATAFTRSVAQARAAAEPDVARKLFREALALWRGPALTGVDARAVRQRAAVLDEQHAVALEDWIDLELAGGRDRDLVAELTGLVEQFPLRERLRVQLMLSLYRVGRQADALAEYRRARELLQTELGIEPGPGLQDLHRRILAGDLTPEPVAPAEAVPVRCLPRTVGDFTGRDEAVGRLLDAVTRGAAAGPVALVIDGMAGSGKTTLALHVARRLTDDYPDAQLFLDLQGHSENEPVEPAAALLTLLRQLGVPADRIPAAPEERAARWRQELAGRRAIVVLDNAASSAQLTRLLPASPQSVCLVTSRRRLTGLDGVHPESLPVLDEAEGVALLARIGGPRVAAEPEAALEVVRRCGRLPLAIRLAGARLAHRPRWRVADLVRRLGDSALPELAAEDRTVASAFALSYAQLGEHEQRVFRLLGLQPGERFGALAVAALAAVSLDEAGDVLDALVDVHLVEEPEPEVFRLHDLLRQYAAALAAEVPAAERDEAVLRLLDFHLHAFAAVHEPPQLEVLIRDLRLSAPGRPDLAAALTDPAAHAERERPHLAAFVDAGVNAGRVDYAWSLPRAAWRPLFMRGYIAEIGVLLRRGLDAARLAGDKSAVATAANYLASVSNRLGRMDEARVLLETALQLRHELGDADGVGAALGNLATVHAAAGRYAECIALSEQALGLNRRVDSLLSRLRHNAIALSHLRLGNYTVALRHARWCLLAAIELREPTGVASALLVIATIKGQAGLQTTEMGRRMLTAALRLQRAGGYAIGEAESLSEFAKLSRSEGDLDAAEQLLREAIPITQRIGHTRYESLFLSQLGEILLLTGDVSGARDSYDLAVVPAGAIHPYERAVALSGRAEVALAEGDTAGARTRFQEALHLFTRMGVPEKVEVERRLVTLDGGDRGRMDA